jgi:hypothetical protein
MRDNNTDSTSYSQIRMDRFERTYEGLKRVKKFDFVGAQGVFIEPMRV